VQDCQKGGEKARNLGLGGRYSKGGEILGLGTYTLQLQVHIEVEDKLRLIGVLIRPINQLTREKCAEVMAEYSLRLQSRNIQ
jgi:hypothetical protein